MRIRKRSGPLVLSSLSSTTSTTLAHSSDPPLITTNHHEEKEEEKKRLHPSFDDHRPFDQVLNPTSRTTDLQLTIIRGKDGWVCRDDDGKREEVEVEEKKKKPKCMMNNTTNPTQIMEEKKKKKMKGLEEEEDDDDDDEKEDGRKIIRRSSTNYNRKKNSFGGGSGGGSAEEVISGYGVPPLSFISSDHQVGMRWQCEGEKGFPLKKRRGSFERNVEIKEKKIMKRELKTNANKKWVLNEKDNKETQEEEEDDHGGGGGGGGGGVLLLLDNGLEEIKSTTSATNKMEGSRCSRVNGRGWRCCQQTLVGYSLCEHHLGKGRLRSMKSVRNRSITAMPIKDEETKLVSLEKDEDEDEDQEKPLMRIEKKKRKKIGMVKARSISSLLGQTQHDIIDSVKV